MKKKLLAIGSCFILGTTLVVILVFFSRLSRSHANGFVRLFPPGVAIFKGSCDIGHSTWHLGQKLMDNIYLWNNASLNKMLVVDTTLLNQKMIDLKIPDSLQVKRGSFLFIDSSSIYLFDGVQPKISYGSLLNFSFTKSIETKYFTSAVPISNNSFILRSIFPNTGNTLVKETEDSSKGLKINDQLLTRQKEGLFSTDGILLRTPDRSKIIYVYYYRNQFISSDSTLNLLLRGNTIDTISQATIEVSKIEEDNQLTISSPPLYVNKLAAVSNEYLFINSQLNADNVEHSEFEQVSTFDVYTIKDGKYKFSFELPDYKGFKVRDFKIFGDKLIAIFDRYLFIYHLDLGSWAKTL